MPDTEIHKKLVSTPLFHTPGVFRALQNDYKISGRTRKRAIAILSTGYGMSQKEAEQLLSGATPTEIDDAAGTVTYTILA